MVYNGDGNVSVHWGHVFTIETPSFSLPLTGENIVAVCPPPPAGGGWRRGCQ